MAFFPPVLKKKRSKNLSKQDKQCTYNNIETRSRNNCRREKVISITYLCVCVRECRCGCTGACACLRGCSPTYPACKALAPYCLRPLWIQKIFRHYFINSTIVGKKLLNVRCVFWFYLQSLFEIFLILRRIQRNILIKAKTSSCKVALFLSDLNETWIFSVDFRKKLKFQI
jgi:hypothetical protein